MRRSSEVKGVYGGLTLTFVLGFATGFTSGLGLAAGSETGNGWLHSNRLAAVPCLQRFATTFFAAFFGQQLLQLSSP